MYWGQKDFSEKIEKYHYMQNKVVHVMIGFILFHFQFNSGSTIQGDHILAFWQTQKSGSIPENEIK